MNTKILNRAAISLLGLFMLTNIANSQSDFIWGRQFGSDKDEYVLNHVIDAIGNLYVAGKTTGVIEGMNFGKNDGFLTKIDSSGKIIWSRQFGTAEEEDIQWCAIDKSGSVYITGTTTGTMNGSNAGKEDIFIVRYNPEGELIWSKQYGTEGADIAKGIYADSNGNIFVTGATDGKLGKTAYGKNDCFLMKFDSNGNQIFTTQFGTSGEDYCYSVTGGQGSDILVCGSTWGDLGGKNKGMIDGFTGQFTTSGELVKYHQFGTDGFDIAMIVTKDEENNIYVGGTTSGSFGAPQAGEGDAFLIKINDKGDILWNNQFGTKSNDGIRSIVFNPAVSDNMLVSGILNLPPSRAFVRMYRKDGTMVWERNFIGGDGIGLCSGKDVNFDSKGNLYHLGLTSGNLFGNSVGEHDYYLVKLRLDKDSRKH